MSVNIKQEDGTLKECAGSLNLEGTTVVNDTTTETEGTVLDGRMGKILNDKILSLKECIVRKIDFYGTLSPNGNMFLGDFVDTDSYLIISVSARLKDNSSALISCTPYQYSGAYPGYIRGIHCVPESLSGVTITGKDIVGTIYALKID